MAWSWANYWAVAPLGKSIKVSSFPALPGCLPGLQTESQRKLYQLPYPQIMLHPRETHTQAQVTVNRASPLPALRHCAAGRWRGAMVAVKIVTHDRTLATLAETLRESALSTSIQHPNVVRIRVACPYPGCSSSCPVCPGHTYQV